jgi:ergothioneine biosynthesis protein EgtB
MPGERLANPEAMARDEQTIRSGSDHAPLVERVLSARRHTEALCAPLTVEDYGVQSMPDVSPAKWHLAHTTWFFEALVLHALDPSRTPYDPRFGFLFNSYYEAVGPRVARHERGLLSRPTVAEVIAYRRAIDGELSALVAQSSLPASIVSALALGMHHEHQHQELLLTDIKHVLGTQPLLPAYRVGTSTATSEALPPLRWIPFDGGLVAIGAEDNAGFSFDNERPRHKVYVAPFELASRPVTVGEYLAFLEDGGYRRPELWLSDGWALVQSERWAHPLYWQRASDGSIRGLYTLDGVRPLDAAEPLCHVSYFEADAFARWAGARLPTEAEWEVAAAGVPVQGNFLETDQLHPRAATVSSPSASTPVAQLFGDVWEWTQSSYSPYPGFAPMDGVFAEYNGKFMCGQLVLRGGSCVSARAHIRTSYRNFFPPSARWQFSGVRLARSR